MIINVLENTSNLINHLKTKGHEDTYAEFLAKSKSLKESLETPAKKRLKFDNCSPAPLNFTSSPKYGRNTYQQNER